eukprot:3004843-Prymnesium_polylepis.1
MLSMVALFCGLIRAIRPRTLVASSIEQLAYNVDVWDHHPVSTAWPMIGHSSPRLCEWCECASTRLCAEDASRFLQKGPSGKGKPTGV